MTELRQDYLTGQWVSIATNRSTRPSDYKKTRGPIAVESENCPFCPSNRHLTTEEIYKNGRVRVLPNMYPVLDQNDDDGFGFHEVLVDTPNHNERLHEFSVENIAELLQTIRARLSYYSNIDGVKSVQVFKNEGADAGATLAHSHWQILAMPIVPNLHNVVLDNFTKYNEKNNTCYLCELHKSLGDYSISSSGNVVAYAPYASFFSYGIIISTINHISEFKDLDDATLSNMAWVLKNVIKAYYALFDKISYNICFYNVPIVSNNKKVWHFYLYIIPRVGNLAGFELTTGCYINSIDPLECAKKLRNKINNCQTD